MKVGDKVKVAVRLTGQGCKNDLKAKQANRVGIIEFADSRKVIVKYTDFGYYRECFSKGQVIAKDVEIAVRESNEWLAVTRKDFRN